MKKIEVGILSLVLFLALALRLYKIDRPIADWHSWRQADTAAVARNFIKEGFNPFIPRYDDMSSQANGKGNPERYRFVEFPIYNSIIAAVWSVIGISDISARLVTVFITLGSTIMLYFLVKALSGWQIAALSAFFFATIPYNVFYSSAILPAPLMVFFLLALYLAFINWLKNEDNKFLLGSIVFANLAILTWPIALFFMLPLLYLALNKYKFKIFTNYKLWVFALLSILPFAAWRVWMSQFPEGIPNWQFLLNEGGIRFKGSFFRWMIVERIGGIILSVTGFTLFIFGLLKKPQKKENLFYLSWLTGAVLYISVLASGNVRHDYYQVAIIPILAIYMAIGSHFLFNLPDQFFIKSLGKVIALALIAFSFAFGFFEIRGFYWINKPEIVEAGKAVDRLLPKDATVIAPYNGDAAFLYQTNRHGYPIVDRSLEKFIEEGTKYLVSVDVGDDGIQNLVKHCNVIDKTEKYVIVEMFKECIGK